MVAMVVRLALSAPAVPQVRVALAVPRAQLARRVTEVMAALAVQAAAASTEQ
jgi:hypothetical protein